MSYYINLGGIILYGVKEVSDDSTRDMSTYDGIGSGTFAIPDSLKPHSWVIDCAFTETNIDRIDNWTAASKIFTAFEVLLKTKDPSRFIFVSNNRNESMSAFLTSYSKKETYSGVYDVSIKVTEYKPAGIKTTNVPFVKRPGKAPVQPKTVVYNDKTTPYTDSQKPKKDDPVPWYLVDGGVMTYNPKTGKYFFTAETITSGYEPKKADTNEPASNLSAIIDGEQYQRDYAAKQKGIKSDPISGALKAMSGAFDKWKIDWENKNKTKR